MELRDLEPLEAIRQIADVLYLNPTSVATYLRQELASRLAALKTHAPPDFFTLAEQIFELVAVPSGWKMTALDDLRKKSRRKIPGAA